MITTNSMASDLIYIDPLETNKGTPGVLLTGVNVTFTCAAFIKKTVTGNIIGHWENPQCGSSVASHKVTFSEISAGKQKYTQVTTVGTAFDLISNNDTEPSEYKTSSQTGSGVLSAESSNNVKFTCEE